MRLLTAVNVCHDEVVSQDGMRLSPGARDCRRSQTFIRQPRCWRVSATSVSPPEKRRLPHTSRRRCVKPNSPRLTYVASVLPFTTKRLTVPATTRRMNLDLPRHARHGAPGAWQGNKGGNPVNVVYGTARHPRIQPPLDKMSKGQGPVCSFETSQSNLKALYLEERGRQLFPGYATSELGSLPCSRE